MEIGIWYQHFSCIIKMLFFQGINWVLERRAFSKLIVTLSTIPTTQTTVWKYRHYDEKQNISVQTYNIVSYVGMVRKSVRNIIEVSPYLLRFVSTNRRFSAEIRGINFCTTKYIWLMRDREIDRLSCSIRTRNKYHKFIMIYYELWWTYTKSVNI